MRRPLLLMLFAVGLAVGVTWYFGGAELDDPKKDRPSNSSERADTADVELVDHHVPYSEYLRRLGTKGGGVWVAPVKGGRVILHLGVGSQEGIGYFAVLRDDEHPRVLVFAPHNFMVDRSGGFAMSLASMGEDSSPGSIAVYGTFDDGVFRFEKIIYDLYDEDGVIPPGLALKRFSGKIDSKEARLRAYLVKTVGLAEADR